jgi:hypothetical protein
MANKKSRMGNPTPLNPEPCWTHNSAWGRDGGDRVNMFLDENMAIRIEVNGGLSPRLAKSLPIPRVQSLEYRLAEDSLLRACKTYAARKEDKECSDYVNPNDGSLRVSCLSVAKMQRKAATAQARTASIAKRICVG